MFWRIFFFFTLFFLSQAASDVGDKSSAQPGLQRDSAGWFANPLRLYTPLDAYVLKDSFSLSILMKVHLGTRDLV